MATPPESLQEPAPPEAAKQTKTNWETILTLTPVILTVLATLLAGVSSSEMTLAQYFRTLAGQSQSKAGDQWAFFQAKRIRGQGLESSIDLLPALARLSTITPQTLQEAADRLLRRLHQAGKDAQRLQKTVAAAGESLGDSGDSIRQAVEALVQTASEDIREARQTQTALRMELTKPEAKDAFTFLGTSKMPETKDTPVDDLQIDDLLRAVADRKPEKEIAPLVLQLKEQTIHKAIDTSEANARGFEVANEPVSQAIRTIDKQVAAALRPVASFHQAAITADIALSSAPEERTKALDDVRSAASTMARSQDAVRAAAEELNNVFKLARLDYDARRYRREANYNQRVAGLYEIQVRKYSVESDRHRDRSKMFFYGMLFAQAGVAIASISLAARQRSVLWGLAGVAGTVSVAFSLYVYLYR